MHRVWVVVLLIGCSGEAVLKQVEADMKAEEARLQMEVERLRAADREAREAKAQIERLQQDLAETDHEVAAAIDAVVAAQTQADRDSAMAKLDTVRREKAQLESTMAAKKAALDKAKRTQPRELSRECLDNPLAKGCS
jgi:chromosome segregation ATPase